MNRSLGIPFRPWRPVSGCFAKSLAASNALAHEKISANKLLEAGIVQHDQALAEVDAGSFEGRLERTKKLEPADY